MAPDQENREAKAKKREAALAASALHHTKDRTKFKHPQAGLRADINRMSQRSKAGQKIPFSNKKLRDIVLWRHTRKGNNRGPTSQGKFSTKMNIRDNGGELEMDDSKMDTLVGVKMQPHGNQSKDEVVQKDSQGTPERKLQSVFKDLQEELVKQTDKDARKEKN